MISSFIPYWNPNKLLVILQDLHNTFFRPGGVPTQSQIFVHNNDIQVSEKGFTLNDRKNVAYPVWCSAVTAFTGYRTWCFSLFPSQFR